METKDGKNRIDSGWENRTLCRDGNCIGVIGDDGRCKECGLPYEGELPGKTGPTIESPAAPDTSAQPDAFAEPEQPTDSDNATEDKWENRILCPDGNCIGVIGPDGKCKECGRPAEK